jgi:broad specificity phosphatase PhoE
VLLSPSRLYLIRHGQTAGRLRGRCIGSTDSPLSTAGAASALRLGEAFRRLSIDAVYSSRLQRATATAAPIAASTGHEVRLASGLAEIDFGALEGLTFEEVASRHPNLYEQWMTAPTGVHFPGGESYAELKLRAVASLTEILARHRGSNVVAVSHGGPIRAILASILEMPDHAAFSLAVEHAAVTLVEWNHGRPALLCLNVPAETTLPNQC